MRPTHYHNSVITKHVFKCVSNCTRCVRDQISEIIKKERKDDFVNKKFELILIMFMGEDLGFDIIVVRIRINE